MPKAAQVFRWSSISVFSVTFRRVAKVPISPSVQAFAAASAKTLLKSIRYA
jgi:hypothetical protein